MKYIRWTILVAWVVVGASCVKNELYDPSPEVVVHIDWSKLTNIDENDIATVLVGDQKEMLKKGLQPSPFYMEKGAYDAYIYNQPEHIIISNKVATVDADFSSGEIVYPGLFYSNSLPFTVDTTITEVQLTPLQRIGLLDITLNFVSVDSSTIQSISGRLNNVAKSFDMEKEKEENPQNYSFDFTDSKVSLRILGFTNDTVFLDVNIHPIGDTATSRRIDIKNKVKDFNKDKSVPKAIIIDI